MAGLFFTFILDVMLPAFPSLAVAFVAAMVAYTRFTEATLSGGSRTLLGVGYLIIALAGLIAWRYRKTIFGKVGLIASIIAWFVWKL